MKKLFTLLTIATMALVANAYPVTITVDDASHVDYLEYNGQRYTFSGNVLEMEANAEADAYLHLAEPWGLDPSSRYWNKYPKSEKANEFEFSQDYKSVVRMYFYASSGYEWSKYQINTIDMDQFRTETCTVTLHGDPSAVFLAYSDTEFRPTLSTGDNTLKFMPKESPFEIKHTGDREALYQVKLNGEPVVNPDYRWYLNVKSGDVIYIDTEWPDEEVTVSVTLKGDAVVDDFYAFRINYENVENPLEPIKAKMGDYIDLELDNTYRKLVSSTLNGEKVDMGYNLEYKGRITGDMNFVFEMTNKDLWKVNTTVDVPTRIQYIVRNYKTMYPTEENFVIDYPANSSATINISTKSPNYKITSVKLDGVDQINYSGTYSVTPKKDGQELVITTEALDRNNSFIFYFDSPEKTHNATKGLNGWWMDCAQYAYAEEVKASIKAGYNEVYFNEGDFPFKIGVNGYTAGKYAFAYYNGDSWPLPAEQTEIYWPLYPQDKDVFKLFIADEEGQEPGMYDVRFTVDNPASVVSAVMDKVTEVEVANDLVLPYILQGTQFEIAVAEGVEVKVNDVSIEAVEGVYCFSIVGPTNISISGDSGIDSVTVTEPDAAAPIYNLMGVRVSNGTTDTLPAGIYVQQGRKVYVK